MDIVKNYISRLFIAGLKLLVGLLWLFVGRDVVENWNIDANTSHVYWFISGLVLGLVLHAVFTFIREILIIFELITLDRELAEKVLYQSTIENGLAIGIKNMKGKYIYANEIYCELYGVPRNYLIGKTSNSFMDELEVMKSDQEDSEVLSSGKKKLIDNEITVADKKRFFSTTKTPLYNKNKKLLGLYIVRKEVTHTHKIENEIKNLQKKYKRLFDDLPFPSMLLDASTTLATEFNDALLKMLNYKRGEFYRTRLGLYMVDDGEDALDFVNKLIKASGGIREIQLLDKDKNKYDVEAHVNIVKIEEKIYLHIIFRDVTDNKRATVSLVQSEQNYHTLFNHANDAIFIIDAETLAIVEANELAYLWLGYDDGELNTMSIYDVDKAGLEEITREKLGMLSQHKDVLFDHELCTYQGDVVPVEISAHTVIYENKLAYQYVVRDISERKVAEWALRESEERYWQMFENNSSIMLVLDPVKWTIEDANDAAINFYKIKKDAFVGLPYEKVCIGTDKINDENSSHEVKRDLYEATHKLSDNDIRFVEINEAPVEIHGRQLSFNIIRDITGSKETASELNLAKKLFSSSSESVMVLDEKQNILSVNNALINLTGMDENEFMGQKPEIILADRNQKILNNDVLKILDIHDVWKGNIWSRKKTGESYSIKLHIELIKNNEGDIKKFVFMMMPENESWEANDAFELKHINIIGLPDKKHFIDRLEYALKKSRRSGKYIAVVIVDIQRFFDINKDEGFETGDKLLRSVGKRLQFMSRESDYVSHFGADKFAMLMEDIADINKINIVAQKVISTLAEQYIVENKVYELQFSIGISLFPEDSDKAIELIDNAESALESAKLEDTSSYHLFSDKLNKKSKNWLSSERRLHKALKDNEFKLYFMPQISLKDDSLSAIEVLLRWRHPDKGLIEPGEFLVEAENTGFIVAIGDWVFREACHHLNKVQKSGYELPELVINISASQLDEDFLEFIIQVCRDEKVPVNKIALDMKESAILNMTHEQVSVIHSIRDAGASFQIDDFGKGTSTISTLLDVEFDSVKMDARLVHELPDSEKAQKHCKMVHALSEVLKFKIIAEGVEAPEQLKVLKNMQCDSAQGHLFGVAIDIEKLPDYLKNYRGKI